MIDLFINPNQDNLDSLAQDGMFQEIDMGELDEEERQYLLIDKDTGRVYDLRNENQLEKITAKSTRITQDLNNVSISSNNVSKEIKGG
jgi:archaellum component FlaC